MKFLILVTALSLSAVANANNYYFSSSSGDDSRSSSQAQNPVTPWKSLDKLNSIFSTLSAGDNILFLRGDIFYGSITINKSGTSTAKIILGAYGTGARPIISGFTPVNSWINTGSDIWESSDAVSTLSICNMVLINNVNTAMGRTPNTDYWTSTGSSSNSISDNVPGHLNTIDWTGAEVASRTARWHLDRAIITSASGNTINFAGMEYDPATGWGYFIQNDIRTLDTQNEWYYDPATNKLTVYSNGDPGIAQVASLNVGVNLNSRNYITFDNLSFQGFNTNAIDMPSRTGISIQHCDISYIGQKGIYCYPNSPNLSVTNSTFTEINSNGIDAASSVNAYIANNTLFNIGNLAGMGESGDLSYTGIISHGDNSKVLYNNVQNCGYVGIRWDGNATLVNANFIDNTNYVKDDGGGIYTYPWPYGTASNTVYTQRTVSNNIVLNSKGALAGGTPSSNFNEAMGIYNDGTAPNTDYINNTIANAYFGIFSNAGHDNHIIGNTIYNCVRGVQYNNYGGFGIANLTITGNTIVAATAGGACGEGQYAAFYEPGANGMPSSFTASDNVYARPLDETNGWIWSNFNTGDACNTLDQWKSMTGQDATSTSSPLSITNPGDLRFEYNETAVSKTIALGADYMDMRSVAYSGTITLVPYTSVVLLKTGSANILPVANAGPDQTVSLPAIITTLSGSGTDVDGTIVSYKWTRLSGPLDVIISNPLSAITSLTSLILGTYSFELKVTDNNGGIGRDTVLVTVSLLGNSSPASNAGPDQNISLPTNNITLSGSGTDPDGTISSYHWIQISGPAASTIVSPAAAITSIINMVEGVYQFQLTVTDNNGATAIDVTEVTVNSSITSSPYGGAAQVIPGIVELENFDDGGQGIAYHDNTSENLGGEYRITESVDIESSTEGSPNVGWTEAGEWMKYTVNVLTTGNYTLKARVSSQNSSTSFRIEMDGITIAVIDVPNTGGYQSWETVSIPNVPLTAGTKIMRVYFITGGYNLNYISYTLDPIPNIAPISNAGTDQTIILPVNSVTLNGSATDIDGSVTSYLWTKIAGPTNFTIINPTSPSTTINGLAQGIYTFELKVTDNSGATDTDTMQLTVNQAPNILPTANAGVDKIITLPVNTVSITGSGTDPDGTITTYLWTKIAGPTNFTITNQTSASTIINGLAQGIYKFELKVTDNSGATDTDTMQLTVNAAPNILPTANAGVDKVIILSVNTVTINGSGTDPDGTITTYLWTKIAGPTNFTIINPTSPSTTINGLAQGIYKFELKVTDNNGATNTDTMQVTVNPALINQPPIANAGLDQNIMLPNNTSLLNGSATDPDGTITSYLWTKIAGPAAGIISNPAIGPTSATGLTQGIYKFQLKVTDNSGATDTDTMQVIVNVAANIIPISNAGTDLVITLPVSMVSLNGSGSDPDGFIASYLWTKIAGPATGGIITIPASATTSATGLTQGIYKFQLRVTDNNGATDTDTMQVTVNPYVNQLPVAHAGTDQNITLPTNSVSLTGSGTDPDGTITVYQWTKISGPVNGTITNPLSATTAVTGLIQGTYKFQLKVTDNSGATDTDTMKVIVNDALINQPPVANASLDQSITLPVNTVSLNGGGIDPDGTITAYQWIKISGPSNFIIINPTAAITTVTGLVEGIYRFQLKVTDNSGATDIDIMQVNVNAAPASPNEVPVAIAGADTSIYLPVNAIRLFGSGIDPDGFITGYEWKIITGSSFVIVNPLNAISELTALRQGIYEAELTVTDNDGATAKDTIEITVGASRSHLEKDEVRILGNPANDLLSVQINTVSVNRFLKMMLFDINGKLLFEKDTKQEQNVQLELIDISRYSKGTYILEVYFDRATPIVNKIIKM